jgi:acetyltransferase-like isoleucine patch superfamily enzyme
MPFVLSPKRKKFLSLWLRLKYYIQFPFTRFMLWCGFPNVDYAYIHGDPRRVTLGRRCSTPGTIFNVSSGCIAVGDKTLFGHNCMVLTGVHRFQNGQRAKLNAQATIEEVPRTGYDIRIGKGCFIGSGAIILNKVTIGDNVVIGAGSVVTRDIADGSFACGVPAKVVPFSGIMEGRN